MNRLSQPKWIAALIACVVIGGVAGFLVGGIGAPDVSQARVEGERAGERAGTTSGVKEGEKDGKAAGWKAGFGPAKVRARKAAHARTLRAELKRARELQAQQAREAAAAAAAAASQAAEQSYDSCINTYGPDNFPPGNYTWSALVAYCEDISGFDAR